MRYASPIASRPATSLSVMLLFGPRAPCRIETCDANMFGRYLSIHKGWMIGMPCSPHFSRSTEPGWQLELIAGGVGQLRQLAGNQARAEIDAETLGIEFRLVHLALGQARVGRR